MKVLRGEGGEKAPNQNPGAFVCLGVWGMLCWNHRVVNLRWLSEVLLSVEALPCPYREPLDVCD